MASESRRCDSAREPGLHGAVEWGQPLASQTTSSDRSARSPCATTFIMASTIAAAPAVSRASHHAVVFYRSCPRRSSLDFGHPPGRANPLNDRGGADDPTNNVGYVPPDLRASGRPPDGPDGAAAQGIAHPRYPLRWHPTAGGAAGPRHRAGEINGTGRAALSDRDPPSVLVGGGSGGRGATTVRRRLTIRLDTAGGSGKGSRGPQSLMDEVL